MNIFILLFCIVCYANDFTSSSVSFNLTIEVVVRNVVK